MSETEGRAILSVTTSCQLTCKPLGSLSILAAEFVPGDGGAYWAQVMGLGTKGNRDELGAELSQWEGVYILRSGIGDSALSSDTGPKCD